MPDRTEINIAIMHNLVQEMREIMSDVNFEPYCARCIIQYRQFKLILMLYQSEAILYDLSHCLLRIVSSVQLCDPLSLDAKFWVEQIKQQQDRKSVV